MKALRAWLATAGLSICLGAGPALAAKQSHKCVDAQGHVEFSDIACPVAAASTPPPPKPPCPLTADEQRKAERQESQFLARFPDEKTHSARFAADVQEVVARLRLAQGRLSDLRRERKAIDDELGFYERRPVPPELQRRVDANDARFTAMAEVFVGIETEIRTMMGRYECERSLFAIRWAGGAPGSSACMPACKAGTP